MNYESLPSSDAARRRHDSAGGYDEGGCSKGRGDDCSRGGNRRGVVAAEAAVLVAARMEALATRVEGSSKGDVEAGVYSRDIGCMGCCEAGGKGPATGHDRSGGEGGSEGGGEGGAGAGTQGEGDDGENGSS